MRACLSQYQFLPFPNPCSFSNPTYAGYVAASVRGLWSDFRSAYSQPFLVKWSLWWALASCGFYQIGNYIQSLWETMQEEGQADYNGYVEAMNTILGTLACLSMQFINVRWEKWGEVVLGLGTLIDCGLLSILAWTRNIYVSYVGYVIYRLLFQVIITIAQYNIARKLQTESFGLIFGFNTFIALFLQTIMTISVAEKSGLHLKIRPQFVVYGVYHGIIALVFLFMGLRTVWRFHQTISPSESSEMATTQNS